ncbi:MULTISPECIES: hypothetical protein [unclassified Acinetobacter]|uniref:hypothetical protein n=1 Tax=unclassified Acinetobacter TaxID=196816 RepID=UPI0015D198A5|nr:MULTISPECIES: hypothetical protein [unclassified Acinetobacter]
MKKLVQNALLPFAIFSGVLVLIGCEPATAPQQEQEQEIAAENDRPATTSTNEDQSATQSQATDQSQLKSGNMFYIVRDVADMQLKAGNYVEQLKQTQVDLEAAVSNQDHLQLQKAATQLQQQLKGFNQALNDLNLKSTEINDIRSNLQAANQQVLASPFLNGQVDLSKVDFQKIQNQMGNIQAEMLKLAGMLIQDQAAKSSSNATTKTE